MTDDPTQTAIEAAQQAIDAYLADIEATDVADVDTLDLAENVVRAIDSALAGALVAAFNNADQDATAMHATVMSMSPPPVGFGRSPLTPVTPNWRAGAGLYADKCAECTTGVSCDDAGRCLFEG